MKIDESILKQGLRNGDKEIFKYLFISHYPGLIRYGTSLTGDSEAAKELVQDLFLELWEKRESVAVKGSIKPYLYSSIYHKGLNWLRSRKIRATYEARPEEISNWFALPENTERLDPLQLELIERQIEMLPGQCREVFTRAVILGDSQREIAEYLGLNIKTIENHLARARKILREKLKNIR